MGSIFLTPASITYLAQFISGFLITAYLFFRLRSTQRQNHTQLLAAAFAAISTLIFLLFLESASPPTQRLIVVYLQNTALGAALVLLLQFAYRFPGLLPQRKWEARLVLFLSGAYTVWEAGFAVWRFIQLGGAGQVLVRPDFVDYFPIAGCIWIPLVFARQAAAFSEENGVHSTKSNLARIQRLFQPQGKNARAAGTFAIFFLLPIAFTLMNLLRTYGFISFTMYSSFLSIGILFTLLIFTLVYLNTLPESTSFVAKLTGSTIISLLAITSISAWVVAPKYIEAYRPALPLDQRTLRFTPNTSGGYDISEQPFAYTENLGVKQDIPDSGLVSTDAKIDFKFPFYGKTYSTIYIDNDGAIGIGHALTHYNSQFHYGHIPAIFAYYLDLAPDFAAQGGIYLRQEPDRLTITWDRVPSFFNPEFTCTFQIILSSNGVFEITYHGLPQTFQYEPQNQPIESLWLVGITPGSQTTDPPIANFNVLPIQSGSAGLIQDEFLAFRSYLHGLILPILNLMLLGNLFFLIGLPLYLRSTLAQPLYRLLEGVKRLNQRSLTAPIPITANDEIGYLTQSINDVNLELTSLVENLESRVTQRTLELIHANTQLQTEMQERQQAQNQMVHQQRTLAVMEERERLGRELHDNLGQVLAYVNMQTQTAHTKLEKGQINESRQILQRLSEVAQQSHADLRGFILGLKSSNQPPCGFWNTLQNFIENLRNTSESKLKISLNSTPSWDNKWLSPTGELHLLRIIQEALKNADRHANASHASVQISRIEEQLLVEIADDGLGFDPRLVNQAEHFGVKGMEERAAELSGRLEIHSSPQTGTRIRLQCPTLPQPEPVIKDSHPLQALLVDDHPMFLEGLRNLLTANDIQVVGTANNGLQAQELALELRPDLIIMDLEMPECNGLEATRRIKAVWPGSKIVILTVSASEQMLFEALKAGASGYLLKNMNASDFFVLLSGLEQSAPPIAPELALLIQNEFSTATGTSLKSALTSQQQDILKLVALGLTYREVGQRLFLSEAAIKYHMKQILEALQFNSRAQAIAYARRAGLGD